MNELPDPKPVPVWRIILYGLIEAGLMDAFGHWTQNPELYVVAAVVGVLAVGLGFLFKSMQRFALIRDETERRQATAGIGAKLLLTAQVLAVPTMIFGGILIYDLLAMPVRDEAVVVEKTKSYGKHTEYSLQVKGRNDYTGVVPRWFYDECSLNDTVNLSMTPIFKTWRQVSLVVDGTVRAKTNPTDIWWMGFFGFGSLLPGLLWVRRIRDVFGQSSPNQSKAKIVMVYFLVVFMCEIAAVGVGLKFICVLLGLCHSL